MKPRSWRAIAHIPRRIAKPDADWCDGDEPPEGDGASTEMRIEIDAARVGEIDRWTLDRYKQSSKRTHHIPFRDCA